MSAPTARSAPTAIVATALDRTGAFGDALAKDFPGLSNRAVLAILRTLRRRLPPLCKLTLWRRVIDKTGITGEYAFKLEWSPTPGEYGPEAMGLPP